MNGINDKDFANIDGDIVNYDIEYSLGRINPNSQEGFMSSADGDNDEFYNAGGRKKGKSGFAKFWSYTPLGMLKDGIDRRNSPEGLARRDARNQQRLDIRKAKVGAKQTQAEAQVESAKAMAKGTEGDIALAKSLEAKPDAEQVKEGLSKNAKIGIGVGVAVVLGILGFIVYKKMSLKGK